MRKPTLVILRYRETPNTPGHSGGEWRKTGETRYPFLQVLAQGVAKTNQDGRASRILSLHGRPLATIKRGDDGRTVVWLDARTLKKLMGDATTGGIRVAIERLKRGDIGKDTDTCDECRSKIMGILAER